MIISELHDKIALVCPIDGVSSDGRIDFKPEATQEQKDAAQVIMDAELPTLGEPSARSLILEQITILETQITPRRIREHSIAAAKTASSRTSDDNAALAFVNDINSQIAELRVQL